MKIRYVGIILILLALLCGTIGSAGVAYADTNPVILLSGKNVDGEIVVEVNLKNNEGISAMNLSLEYDTDRIVLTGLERGDALSTLDLITTNTDTETGYAVYPFKLNWFGEDNDATNGKMLTLHFVPISEDVTGKARVTFSYTRGQDVNYLDDTELRTRNLLIDVLTFEVSQGQAEEFVHNETLGEDDDNKSTALAIGLAIGGTTAIVTISGIPMILKKRKKIA